MVRVLLRAVRVDLQSNTPVLLLQETEGEGRTLPIFIGSPEATAIAYALQGVTMPRPLTHDLMKDMLGALDISVERVIITELRASTYYAEMHLVRGEERTIVSSRPSDAVAVAVRTESPLFVSDELMESEGIILALDTEDEEDDTPDNWWGSSGSSSTPYAPRTSRVDAAPLGARPRGVRTRCPRGLQQQSERSEAHQDLVDDHHVDRPPRHRRRRRRRHTPRRRRPVRRQPPAPASRPRRPRVRERRARSRA